MSKVTFTTYTSVAPQDRLEMLQVETIQPGSPVITTDGKTFRVVKFAEAVTAGKMVQAPAVDAEELTHAVVYLVVMYLVHALPCPWVKALRPTLISNERFCSLLNFTSVDRRREEIKTFLHPSATLPSVCVNQRGTRGRLRLRAGRLCVNCSWGRRGTDIE